MRTITRMYDSYAEATAAVRELEASGIRHDNISLIANADAHERDRVATTAEPHTKEPGNAGKGAAAGAVLGGGAGLLAGIGALAIPGVGPIVAAGWLVATLTGAAVGAAGGGLVGALTSAGVSHEEAGVYAEGVKRGSTLVTVRAEDAEAVAIESVLDRRSPVDWRQRRESYGADWKGFNEADTRSTSTVYPDRPATTSGTTGPVGPSQTIDKL